MDRHELATNLIRSTLLKYPSIARIAYMLPSVDELLALDWLTLRTHTEQAGDAFDMDEHRRKLKKALGINEVCSVRREGRLVAYAMLRPDVEACGLAPSKAGHEVTLK
ncbi:hypothetical protein [Burkholderia glumae]